MYKNILLLSCDFFVEEEVSFFISVFIAYCQKTLGSMFIGNQLLGYSSILSKQDLLLTYLHLNGKRKMTQCHSVLDTHMQSNTVNGLMAHTFLRLDCF